MTTTDPDNDGDNDSVPDADDGVVLGLGMFGYSRPMKSVRQHKHRMEAPGTTADAPPEIGKKSRRGPKS